MNYKNYCSEIYSVLDSYYDSMNMERMHVVIFGLSVLGQVIASYFDTHKTDCFYIVDNKKAGSIWMNVIISNPSDILPILPNNSVIIIAPKNKTIYEDIIRINSSLESKILDLSYFTPDYLMSKFRTEKKNAYLKEISLKEGQMAFLPLLKDFHNFCCEHNLIYYLEFGTLLGAVRHNGFIPWDDDIDVSMPVKDYLKFCELYKTEGKQRFESVYNMESYIPLSSVTKIKSSDIFTEYGHFPVVSITGICLDIMPICGFPSDHDEQIKFMREFYRIGEIWKHEAVITHGTDCCTIARCEKVRNMMDELLLRYDYSISEYVGPVYFMYVFGNDVENHAVKKEYYNERTMVSFEGNNFYAPRGYDELLKHWYGNYMELPSEEKRISMNTGRVFIYNGLENFYN